MGLVDFFVTALFYEVNVLPYLSLCAELLLLLLLLRCTSNLQAAQQHFHLTNLGYRVFAKYRTRRVIHSCRGCLLSAGRACMEVIFLMPARLVG